MNDYLCADLYTSAALLASHMHLKRMIRMEGSRRAAWLFANPENEAERCAAAYWNGKLDVNAKEFVNCLYDLRKMLDANSDSVSSNVVRTKPIKFRGTIG